MTQLSAALDFATIYSRDIDRLHAEISAFTDEAKLWEVSGEVTNSAGNLCLHLVGNLNHFIGTLLGHTGYIRQREKEFSDKHVPRETLLSEIEAVKTIVINTLQGLTDEDLVAAFPATNFGEGRRTAAVLTFLSGHLNYHLGQINYLRRL